MAEFLFSTNFLFSATYYWLVSGVAFCFLSHRFGRHGRGSLSPLLETGGTVGVLALIVLVLFHAGLFGLLGAWLALGLWGAIAERLLYFYFKRFTHVATGLSFREFTERPSRSAYLQNVARGHQDVATRLDTLKQGNLFETMEKIEAEEQNEIGTILANPQIRKVLGRHNVSSDEIRDIKRRLILAGSGGFAASKVIQDPDWLEEYLKGKESGATEEELAFRFVKRLGGP